jgi:hypothetical protein
VPYKSRLYAASSIAEPQGGVFTLDPTAFLTHLLVFDEYTLQSFRLSEFSQLISYFSAESIARLVRSDWLRVDCAIANLGITNVRRVTRLSSTINAFGPYETIHFRADQRQASHEGMHKIDDAIGRGSRLSKRIRRDLADRLIAPDDSLFLSAFAQAKTSLRARSDLVASAVALGASRHIGQPVTTADFSIELEPVGIDAVTVRTDLVHSLGIGEATAFAIVDSGVSGILGYYQRLELMQRRDAVVALRQNEQPFAEAHIAHLARELDPSRAISGFHRVVTCAGLPDLVPGTASWVDLDRLIDIRSSAEAAAFREWLWTADGLTETELAEKVSSLRAKLGLAISTTKGRIARFALSTLGGLVPGAGPMIGTGLGALDQFVVDRLLSPPAPLMFLGAQYPSIFSGGTR